MKFKIVVIIFVVGLVFNPSKSFSQEIPSEDLMILKQVKTSSYVLKPNGKIKHNPHHDTWKIKNRTHNNEKIAVKYSFYFPLVLVTAFIYAKQSSGEIGFGHFVGYSLFGAYNIAFDQFILGSKDNPHSEALFAVRTLILFAAPIISTIVVAKVSNK